MPTSEEVFARAKQVSHLNIWLVRWEVNELSHVLFEGELLENLVAGKEGKGTVLVAATDIRVISVRKEYGGKATVRDYLLEKVVSVQDEPGFLSDSLKLEMVGGKLKLVDVPKGCARPFAETLRYLVANRDASPQLSRDIAPALDLAGEIERLVKLRDAGALTDEEFTAAKRKLLGN